MKNRRGCYRFASPFLKAQCFSRKGKGPSEKCTIFNISRKGICLKFHTGKKIKLSSAIHLEMYVARKTEPIKVKGVVRWVEKEGNDFIGSIELIEELDDATWEELFRLPLVIGYDNDDSQKRG